jgi:integral membrane protein
MIAPDLRDPVGRVRAVGMVEGVSFLLLMGVAMPLKYLADLPLAVTYVGWAHGVLFVAFVLVLFQAWAGGALSFGKSALALLAALLPFGPFLIDRKLAKSGHSPD